MQNSGGKIMDDSIPVRNNNHRCAMKIVIAVCLITALGIVGYRFTVSFEKPPAVELEIVCHSEYVMDIVYDNPIWERQVDGGYESFGGPLPVHFFLVVKNNNPHLPLCIYRPQYSFGYYDLHFECRANGIITSIVRCDGVSWFKNVPEQSVIQPRSSLAMPICLDKSLWKNAPEVAVSEWGETSDSLCTIRAIMTNGVWKIGSEYKWATPHVLTSQWANVSLFGPERNSERNLRKNEGGKQ